MNKNNTEMRECNSEECNWKGVTDRMIGTVGPLCPECGETTEPASGYVDERIMKAPVPARPILYTDTISGEQCMRDDMWAVTTDELNALSASQQASELPPLPQPAFFYSTVVPEDTPTFTADQMRDYALAARAAQEKKA